MFANPLPDEAYYWLWSKNIALSYFDHPPLMAWVQYLLLYLSDNKYFLIRTLPCLSLGIVLTIIVFWQIYRSKKIDYNACLKNVVLFLAFPIFSIFFSVSFPDYLLITLLFASAFFIFLYFERKGIYYWYFAVFLFSLALLTKYNAVLFGIGVLGYILYYKKTIMGPSYFHVIVSTLIILLIQTPVLFWNLDNDFASFSFHLNERLDSENNPATVLKNTFDFLSGVLLAFSPIFIFSLKNNFHVGKYFDESRNFVSMGNLVLVFSISFCIFLSYFTNVLYYWLIPAIVLLIPFLNEIIRIKMWQYLHIFYGILISLILFINTSVYPISAFFGDVDRETAILFGWDKIIEVVSKEKKERGIEKVIFSDYRLGSLYVFHSGDFEVDVVMEERKTQFDVWRNQDNQLQKKILIFTDKDFPFGQKILSNFKSIKFVRDIEIYLDKKLIKKYRIFLGTNK